MVEFLQRHNTLTQLAIRCICWDVVVRLVGRALLLAARSRRQPHRRLLAQGLHRQPRRLGFGGSSIRGVPRLGQRDEFATISRALHPTMREAWRAKRSSFAGRIMRPLVPEPL